VKRFPPRVKVVSNTRMLRPARAYFSAITEQPFRFACLNNTALKENLRRSWQTKVACAPVAKATLMATIEQEEPQP
jgi:hypothetical protein